MVLCNVWPDSDHVVKKDRMLMSNWNCSNVVFLSQIGEIFRSDLRAKRDVSLPCRRRKPSSEPSPACNDHATSLVSDLLAKEGFFISV